MLPKPVEFAVGNISNSKTNCLVILRGPIKIPSPSVTSSVCSITFADFSEITVLTHFLNGVDVYSPHDLEPQLSVSEMLPLHILFILWLTHFRDLYRIPLLQVTLHCPQADHLLHNAKII